MIHCVLHVQNAVEVDLLAAEFIDGSSHLVVQLLVELALLGFVPAAESTETIRKRRTDGHRETRSGHAGYSGPVVDRRARRQRG